MAKAKCFRVLDALQPSTWERPLDHADGSFLCSTGRGGSSPWEHVVVVRSSPPWRPCLHLSPLATSGNRWQPRATAVEAAHSDVVVLSRLVLSVLTCHSLCLSASPRTSSLALSIRLTVAPAGIPGLNQKEKARWTRSARHTTPLHRWAAQSHLTKPSPAPRLEGKRTRIKTEREIVVG